jgi:pantothenate synthetase
MICEQETQKLQEQGLQVEYLEICHEKGLERVNKREEKEIRVFVAAYAGGIRLIDNLSLSDED